MKKGLWILLMVLGAGIAVMGCGDDTGPGTPTETEPTDTGCDAQQTWIGEACESNTQCQEMSCDITAFCHPFVFTCTKGCEPVSPDAIEVGGCGATNAVCAGSVYPVPGGHANICAEPCEPGFNYNDCSNKDLTCTPDFGFSVEAMTSTCQLPACFRDEDCALIGLVAFGGSCTNNDQCTDGPGGECHPVDFVCTYPKTCDELTGRCIFQNSAQADAEIGDPCEHDMECGSGMFCFRDPDNTAPADQVWANGYCSKSGCLATVPELPGGSLQFHGKAEFDCGDEGSCFNWAERGGVCLRGCNPNITSGADACRQPVWGTDTVLDKPGDYECYPNYMEPYGFNYATAPGTPQAQGPFFAPYTWESVCMPPTFGFSCDDIADIDPERLNCSESFGDGSANMVCRDKTGAELTSGGYCYDNTTSGFLGTWEYPVDTDSGTDTDTDTDTDSDTDTDTTN